MNKTRHYIRTLLLMLLLLAGGGMGNVAWAQKVTYHILTKPFTVKNHNNDGDFAGHVNIRVEALQCVSEEATVGLPEQFKSPLAKNFKYWANATSTYDKLYDSGYGTQIVTTKYYIYSSVSDEITPGSNSDNYTDIYVTYEYINDGENEGYKNGKIELDGATKYNISITSGGVQKHIAYNRSRNNRIANVNDAALTGEHLANDEFVIPEEGTDANQLGFFYSGWGPVGLFFGFKLAGEDPYNISLETSYEGGELHITDKAPGDNTGTIKPLAGASLFSKLGNSQMWFDASNNMHYKIKTGYTSASDYTPEKYESCKELWEAASAAERAENWVGYYRNEFPTLNSYVLLTNTANGDYMLVASKANQGNGSSTKPTINQPDSKNQYYSYYDAYDTDAGKKRSQPYFKLQALSSALPIKFYEIKTYTVHVKTHGATGATPTTLTATMRWSDARLSDNPADHIPEVLKRKYCTYTAYKDAYLTQPVTTFQAIQDANNGMNIYLDYTVSESMPFETLPEGGDYTNARWYTMRMDGVANPKYIAYEGTSNSLVVTDGSGAAKGSNTASELHQGENSAEAMVAFMGDPYELKILNRKACVDESDNRFIGCNTSSEAETVLTTDKTGSSDISKWEIVYESIGETGMLLRQFNTAANPKYIGLGAATDDKPVTYSATASRIRVVELEKKKYAFHIMRRDGTIAVMATTMEEVGKALKGDYTDIPEIIRSPYLSTATVNFYESEDNATSNNPDNKITNLPYDGSASGVYAHIWVRYSFTSAPTTADYNVRVNNDYIYTTTNEAAISINSKPQLGEEEATNGHFVWEFDFSDPYALKISNTGIDGDAKYVDVSFSDQATISWSATPSLFIAKSGNTPGTYEVMAATGNTIDASTEYYNIGRPSANTVKLYSNSSYLSGNATLRFQLSAKTAVDVTYHLVDMYKKVLLDAKTRQSLTDDLPAFPPEYYSPLVSKYYYHKTLDHAEKNRTTNQYSEGEKVGQSEVWVTYDVNDLVDLKAGQLYLMKYEAGEEFYQENGSDGLTTEKQKAIYPYVNGDGNFFVYGQEQYDLQQEGASSTRTRWAWYVESNVEGAPKGDPYHVTIKSRQTESYPITNSSEYNAYFMTYQPDGHNEVITTLGWPGMNSETATEYMVLGSEGQYQLVTTNEIGGSRYVVDSFEQYWKTWDTIRKKVLGDSSAKENDSDPITVPETDKDGNPTATATAAGKNNRTYLSEIKGWHHYEKWAYAKRWNGFNNGYSSTEGTHEKKKGWEKIEHWYQTVKMGQGYFDFVKTDITPVLILLDQHGWEIMRKPLPTDPDDPQKDVKYAAIRPYNSPMVKEYAFWATAKKRTGFHQYYLLSDRIGGDDFTSTDLTNLPPYGSANVKDKKGNLNDQYVTYIVKDEYAQTYQPGSTPTAKPFLIEQGAGHKYATTNADGTTLTASDIPSPYTGDMKAYILNGNIQNTEKWYVKPNANIDYEMGYSDSSVPHDWEAKTPNGYEDSRYSTLKTSVYIKKTDEYKDGTPAEQKALTDMFGQFSFSNGFDPYNIQIQSVQASSKYMKTNANGAELNEGSIVGSYPSTPGTVTMGVNSGTISPNPKWYDSRNLYVTNATFMAVQDADGNMQLMPRFDHSTRMSEFGTLIAPTDANVATTYTKLYRPEVYYYLIIDNDGKESLRYKSGGDMMPQTPSHFQSPLATNFTYYSSATKEGDTYTIDKTKEIEESLDGAELTDNTVYVRYEYNDESDSYNMLKGNWLTMKLNNLDTKYDNGIKKGTSKPTSINSNEKAWQWKFTESPQSEPDPYAVYILNRSQEPGAKAITNRFALLSHSAGGYALAQAGENTTYNYSFLNGNEMSTSKEASVEVESGFKPTVGTFYGIQSQVILTDEVQHAFTYKVYTNGGVNAVDATQTQEEVLSNEWKPVLPEAARTPLLNLDQYRYYEQGLGDVQEKDTLGKSLSVLYGLYDDVVFTHYTPYNADISSYLVPNVRNATNVNPVAPGLGSNDAPVGLDGKRPYNIYWYQDEIMKSYGTTITSETDKELQTSAAYEWEFEGEDPYAIKIKSVGANGYIKKADSSNSCNLSGTSETATTFMLLNKEGYDYGVFTMTGTAATGQTLLMLSGHGDALATSDPTHFIPFALSTYKVIYHLMIKNIGSKVGVVIPYRGTETGNNVENYRIKGGTTLRDLESKGTGDIAGDYYQLGVSLKSIQAESSGLFKRDSIYCVDAGHISLGDAFEVPQVFYRPNVSYDFYIEGVYNEHGTEEITDMNTKYKGLKMNHLGEDSRLLGNIVFVNIVYNFLGGLDTNSGSDFVESVSQNKWYTYETNGATPMLAECTGTTLKTVSGYATHYTNDYLWTPVGDPYGFKMYNRYLSKNLAGNMVMSSSDLLHERYIEMVADDTSKPHLPTNSVYELLSNSSTTPGYFRIHPVANRSIDAALVYMNNNTSTGEMTLNTTATEWTFGLSEEVMRPYYQAAGYVGGLNAAGKAAYEKAASKTNPLEKLMTLQDVVYNHDNNNSEEDETNPNYIVHYTPGYYRLHSQPGSSGISTPRYASGYTHKTELNPNGDSSEAGAIPLHFYEVEKYDVNNPTFRDLESGQYTSKNATRGDIPLVTVDKDPASIFQFKGETTTGVKLSTQGLYVKENKMTATEGGATSFDIIDIGAGVVALQEHEGANFLKYAQDEMKFDLKFDNTASTIESTRWCMQPVQKSEKAGDGEMGLVVKTNNGGDDYYYASFYAPFDALLTNENDVAYVVKDVWPETIPAMIHPKRIGNYNTAENSCPEEYRGSSQFIPAGTPVIIRTKNTGGEVTMALPNTSSSQITTDLRGEYLEQMLNQSTTDYILVFGRSYTHSADFTYNGETGEVTPAGLEVDKGVGFYKNANTNRESNETKTLWTRNNKYVYANKIYYLYTPPAPSPSPSRELTRSPEFIPVVFDEDDDADEPIEESVKPQVFNGCVYDLQGRCVATEEMVKDGTWRHNLKHGIYILNGKKIYVK